MWFGDDLLTKDKNNKQQTFLPDIAILVLFTLLLISLQFINLELAFDRDAIQNGQIWRIWTGNLVHLNWKHLGMNLAGLWLLVFIFKPYHSTRLFFISLILLITGEALCLLFFSTGKYYLGLSSSLYGLYLIYATLALRQKDYFVGLFVLIFLPIKVIWDHLISDTKISDSFLNAPVATDAHLYAVGIASFISLFLYFYKTDKNNDIHHIE